MSNHVRRSGPYGYIHAWSGNLADDLTELPPRALEAVQGTNPSTPGEWADDFDTLRRVLDGVRCM